MESLFKDVRYGVRMLARNPAFTVVAVLALALGIGAITAIFSVVNAVLLRPLPFAEPDRLMMIRETKLPQFPEFSVSPGNFLDWQKQNGVFERLVAIQTTAFNLIEAGGEPERLQGQRVTDGFLAMLGVQPAIGRDFMSEEDQPGHNQVVIISNGLWQRRFAGDPNILNQTIVLNGQSYTIIGVMPATFRFGGRTTELWMPMGFTADQAQQHGGHYLQAIGRLKPGVSVEQARTEMSAIADRLAEQIDSDAGWNVKILPLLESAVRDIKLALYVLLAAVGFVLLIACANVANLLLARAASRQKEIAIRTAMGASRWRIVRQLLTESVLLSMLGGVIGLLLAIWGKDILLSLAPENLPRVREASLDGWVLLFTVGITLLTGLSFGLVPALQASKPNLNETLKDAGRGSTEGGRRHLVRSVLVVLEVATALVLLVGAGLMMKSFWRLQSVDPGFNPNNALTVQLSLPQKKYAEDDQKAAFYKQLIDKVSTLPGVQAVGAAVVLPLDDDFVLGFDIQGRPPLPPGEDVSTNYYSVTPDYFKAMGIPLLRGRLFNEHDEKAATRVIIINETMAKTYFPDEDPIGKRINVTMGKTLYREVVGIVGDVKQYGLDQKTPAETYEPFAQQPFSSMSLVVRTAGDPTNLSAAIRSEVLAIDKEQPVSRIRPLNQLVATSIAQQRFAMLLLGVFAAVAMLLAAVGIYGVMSYSVTQRTHEIGIRMALGAGQGDVLRLVVGHGMLLTLIGVVIGLVVALLLTHVMAALLFGVSATDLTTFAVFSISLTVVALIACLVPARRATRVDPMIALRYE